jgi:hypothetical protein
MEAQSVITTGVHDVRAAHGRMFWRVAALLRRHQHEFTPEGWVIFSRIAFSLYSDARTIDSVTPLPPTLRPARPRSR